MLKVEPLPPTPGVYALSHAGSQQVYVGVTNNLRHRAAVWLNHFRQKARYPAYSMPVKNFPDYPGEEWIYTAYSSDRPEEIRDLFVREGYTPINMHVRKEGSITFRGKTQSLAAHCRDLDIPYSRAYARMQKGKSIEEVLKK